MKVHLYALSPSGQSVPVTADPQGYIGGSGSGAPADSAANGWKYVALTGGITGTSDVVLAAAAGAGRSNYLSAIQIVNASATATEVVVKDGSTVIWRGYAAQNFPINVMFPRPLPSSGNTALNAACITGATQTYINAQGYISGLPNEVAIERSIVNELVDDLGAYVTDDAGANIWVDA